MVITQIKINSKKGKRKKKKNVRYTTKAHHVTPIV